MFKKLDKMLERYEKLNELVADPAVLAKMDEWKAYSKELAGHARDGGEISRI